MKNDNGDKEVGFLGIIAGLFMFIFLSVIVFKLWKFLFSGYFGKIIFIVLLILIAGIVYDTFYHTGLFLANEK